MKRLLRIVVAATRPLTLAEINLALALRQNRGSYKDLEVMPEAGIRKYITDLCGLFVTVEDSKIYLFHQTAREFLVQKDDPDLQGDRDNRVRWKYSLRPSESHRILYQTCIRHLFFNEFETNPLRRQMDVSNYLRDHVFLDYSATNWATHLRASDIEDHAVIETLLQICNPSSQCFQTWFRIYRASIHMDRSEGFRGSLMIASYFGLEKIVQFLLRTDDVEVNAVDRFHRRSALSYASENGFDGVVKLLIEGPTIPLKNTSALSIPIGAEVNTVDKYGRTPLSYAAWNGHMAVAERLIKAGARADLEDEIGATPISYALYYGHEAITSRLMKGAQIAPLDEVH